MLKGREATVVGAGIAGLAVARALAMRGARVTVLERAGEIAEVGAGLQISPNGHRVLQALGVAEAVAAGAVRGRAVRLRNGSGADVLRLDLAAHAPDRSFLFLHRADLLAALDTAARDAGVVIETGCEVIGVQQTDTGLRLALADGSRRTTGLAIGADGLHSRLRAALNGAAQPFFTGQVAWRALAPAPPDGAAPEVSVFMGPGRHLVRYPLRGGRLINLVAVEERADWTAEGWHHRDDPGRLRAAFAGFAPGVRALLDTVEEVFLWGLFRHPVAANWHGAHAAILGDAAHPTLPFLAQGANLALEDAWVLARSLGDAPQPQALAAYQAARRARAVRTIDAASANARNYHLRNPLVRGAAHAALRLGSALAPRAALARFEWLYGYDATRD